MLRIREGAEITHRIPVADEQPVACMLGGPDRRTLFVMVGRVAEPGDKLRELCCGRIDTARVEVPKAGRP